MKYNEKRNTKITEYDSISEFISHINSLEVNKIFKNAQLSSDRTNDTEWSGTDTYDEAVELLTKGWSPAAEKINIQLNLATKKMQPTQKPRPVYDVVGYAASVPRYMQGLPTNMIRMKNTIGPIRIITMTKDISFSSHYSSKKIMEEGVKCLQIIKALEEQNIRCKLYVYIGSRVDNETLICKICVKQPNERINILKTAFPMTHTGMLRRFMFRWLERHPTMVNNYTYSYGRPVLYESDSKTEYCIPTVMNISIDDFVKNVLNKTC